MVQVWPWPVITSGGPQPALPPAEELCKFDVVLVSRERLGLEQARMEAQDGVVRCVARRRQQQYLQQAALGRRVGQGRGPELASTDSHRLELCL